LPWPLGLPNDERLQLNRQYVPLEQETHHDVNYLEQTFLLRLPDEQCDYPCHEWQQREQLALL
jgi:hypothetical protein